MIGLLPEKYRYLEKRNYETEKVLWRRRTKRVCAGCGKTFFEKKTFSKTFVQLFCTQPCESTYYARKIRRKRTEPNMQSLYNCKRIDATHYRVTKFDSGFVPFEHHDGTASTYVCTEKTCDCPQGHKPSCRHRKMLPFFLEEEHVDDNWFFIWDTHQWIKADGIFAEAMEEQNTMEKSGMWTGVGVGIRATDEQLPPLPPGTSLVADIPFIPAPDKEGGNQPASATPSSRPSTYRRMR
jgi:hypothetical protein